MADDSNGSSQDGQATEDMLAKYKRLVSLARSSLETNQLTIAAKDQQIAQLVVALEDERSKRMHSRVYKDDDGSQQYPRRIICRVDVEGAIWLLIEYESAEDDWKRFTDELSLQDFIKRVSGVPIACPQKCLSSEESTRLVLSDLCIFLHLSNPLSMLLCTCRLKIPKRKLIG
jgi:hypothetical protein